MLVIYIALQSTCHLLVGHFAGIHAQYDDCVSVQVTISEQTATLVHNNNTEGCICAAFHLAEMYYIRVCELSSIQ